MGLNCSGWMTDGAGLHCLLKLNPGISFVGHRQKVQTLIWRNRVGQFMQTVFLNRPIPKLWLEKIMLVNNSRGEPMSYKMMKKTIDFCKKTPFKLVKCCCFPLICSDKNQAQWTSKNRGIYIGKLDSKPYYHCWEHRIQLLIRLSKYSASLFSMMMI